MQLLKAFAFLSAWIAANVARRAIWRFLHKPLVMVLCCAALHPAGASTKPEPVYQDAILKSMHIVNEGRVCSSSSTSTTDGDSSQTRRTSGSEVCAPRKVVYYTVIIGEQTIVVRPKVYLAEVGAAILTLGISNAFRKESVLYGRLPGTPIKIRQDDSGTFFVKIGKRESAYRLTSAD